MQTLKTNFNKFLPKKLGNKLALLYEDWVIPPQNESLIEIKRKEFRERTKYLHPTILYTLTDEEKTDLRNQGFFVDLNDKTIRDIKDFKLTYNRHADKYRLMNWNSNFALYNTKFYYTDQNITLFYGDPQYYNKMWRNRSRVKFKLTCLIVGYIALYLFYRYRLRQHTMIRKKFKKLAETNPNVLFRIENVP